MKKNEATLGDGGREGPIQLGLSRTASPWAGGLRADLEVPKKGAFGTEPLLPGI